jgi:hypothetical protein
MFIYPLNYIIQLKKVKQVIKKVKQIITNII